MKTILYISNHNPFGTSYGAEQRSNILLKAFLHNGCHVDVAYIGERSCRPESVATNIEIVYWNDDKKWKISRCSNRKRLALIKMFPASDELSDLVGKLMEQKVYDYVACRYLPFAALANLDRYSSKLILDIDDMPAQATSAHLAKKTGLRAIYQKLMLSRMQAETLRWIKKTHTCFLPNSEQAARFGCVHLPNIPIVDTASNLPNSASHNLLFIGKLDWRPNYEGVAHFVRNCWKSILEKCPDAKFFIAGKGLSPELIHEFQQAKNVEVLGFVESLNDFYRQGSIVVSPVYSGAGTNIKVAEAMAMGKACVLTPFSAKGYEKLLHDGDNVFIATTDDEMINKTISLLKSSELCETMGRKSLELASSHFSQSRVNNIIKSVIDQTI